MDTRKQLNSNKRNNKLCPFSGWSVEQCGCLYGAHEQYEALEIELEQLKSQTRSHVFCHDIVCNASRRAPRGEKGSGCSCSDGSSYRMRDALEKAEVHTQNFMKEQSQDTVEDLIEVILTHPLTTNPLTNRDEAILQVGNFNICTWNELLELAETCDRLMRKQNTIKRIINE